MNREKYVEYLKLNFVIREDVIDLVDKAEASLDDTFSAIDDICQINQAKVLKAFQENRINDTHFGWNTGYGYDDAGREAVERVYASVFGTEKALVRPNIVNGTHAISCALFGMLKPGDELVYASGSPYDTLHSVIGTRKEGEFAGTLLDYGIKYREIPLASDLDLDIEAIRNGITEQTKVVAIQRSTGYDWRPAIPLSSIIKAAETIHSVRDDLIVFVDNCYGEFVETEEPTDHGVDVMAGSLIKNPGGGLALSGGYIAGRGDLIDRISYRLTCPGIGAECGLTYGQNRTVLQGLFLSPKVVNSAIKAAILCGTIFDRLGYEVCPSPENVRSDIIQAIKFNDKEKMIRFCQAVQSSSPIDSYVTPVPWDMPGYDDQVVMASGSFVQGSSIELSADAPVREPYIAYFQGGLTYEHARLGIMKSLSAIL